MTIKREIIYPFFIESSKFADDIFWENIFEDLAYGKTPYGSYISKDFLSCNYTNKEFSYKIERKDPYILYTEIYNLLVNKLGILSQKEKIKKKIEFNRVEQVLKNSRKEWVNIRKKNIKDLLIEKYVIDMKRLYNLTIKQTKYLVSIIFIGLVFKVLTNKDIVYYDNKIHNIHGISFIDKNIILDRDFYYIEQNSSVEIILENKKLMSDNWERYLKQLKKTPVTERSPR